MKIYLHGIHLECIGEAFLMGTHNKCFHVEIRKYWYHLTDKKKTPYLELCILPKWIVFWYILLYVYVNFHNLYIFIENI